jgi:hypothetical protein
MTNNTVTDMAGRLLRFNKPLLVAGGGGYHVDNTVRGWALAWRAFAGEDEEHDFSAGMGGVMLGSSEWAGGLRDHTLPVTAQQRQAVEPELRATIEAVIQHIFRHHGLGTHAPAGCVAAPGG